MYEFQFLKLFHFLSRLYNLEYVNEKSLPVKFHIELY